MKLEETDSSAHLKYGIHDDIIKFKTQFTTMKGLFFNNDALFEIDLFEIDTGKVTDMSMAFSNCNHFEKINFGKNFKTKLVGDMQYMFYGCESSLSLDLSTFNTENVELMANMFREYSTLTSLDLSSFKTPKLNNMNDIFKGMTSLKYFDIINRRYERNFLFLFFFNQF